MSKICAACFSLSAVIWRNSRLCQFRFSFRRRLVLQQTSQSLSSTLARNGDAAGGRHGRCRAAEEERPTGGRGPRAADEVHEDEEMPRKGRALHGQYAAGRSWRSKQIINGVGRKQTPGVFRHHPSNNQCVLRNHCNGRQPRKNILIWA